MAARTHPHAHTDPHRPTHSPTRTITPAHPHTNSLARLYTSSSPTACRYTCDGDGMSTHARTLRQRVRARMRADRAKPPTHPPTHIQRLVGPVVVGCDRDGMAWLATVTTAASGCRCRTGYRRPKEYLAANASSISTHTSDSAQRKRSS